jgi:hypothetical protein
MYGLKPDDYIAKELNRPKASIQRMAETLFPPIERSGPWTDAEVDRMKRYLGVCDVEVIARIFGRALADIRSKIAELDRNKVDREWTHEEIADLKRLYGTRTDEDIARIFQRPVSSVAEKASELCLAKDKAFVRKISGDEVTTRMPRWTAKEIEVLKEMYPAHSNLEIAQLLNRSVKSVVSKAHNIGLKKDPRRLQEMGRQNVSLRYSRQESDDDDDAKSESSSPTPPEEEPRARGDTTEARGATGGGDAPDDDAPPKAESAES